jgi:hypothetical protein
LNKKELSIYFIIVVLIIISSGYFYARNIISDISKTIIDNIEEEDWRVEDYVLFPPSMKLVLTYSISNPSKTPVEIEMDIDFYSGDYKISNLKKYQKILPGDKSTFEIELDYTFEILEKIYGNVEGYDKFTMDGWFKVKGNILFYPVESKIIFNGEDVSSILPLFDAPF